MTRCELRPGTAVRYLTPGRRRSLLARRRRPCSTTSAASTARASQQAIRWRLSAPRGTPFKRFLSRSRGGDVSGGDGACFGVGGEGWLGFAAPSEPQATPSALGMLQLRLLRACKATRWRRLLAPPRHLRAPTPRREEDAYTSVPIEACIARTHKTHLASVGFGQRPCARPQATAEPATAASTTDPEPISAAAGS